MNMINPGTNQRVLPVLFKEPVAMTRGDLFHHTLAGGGGYGDPLERDVSLILRDLHQGRVSAEGVQKDYGVVAAMKGTEWVVNQEATDDLRAARRSAKVA
jgi:N-methylhydantoinase B